MENLEAFPSEYESISGCLLGATIGDALGLPFEGLSPKKIQKRKAKLDSYSFLFNKGMCSDDTEHICMTAQSLISSELDPDLFGEILSKKIKFWFLGLPAGIGLATLKSSLKLLIGFKYDKSGIFSAGNGPSMRSSILGAVIKDDMDLLKKLVYVSTRITHTDPKAEYSALAIALAANFSKNSKEIVPDEYLNKLFELIPDNESEFKILMKNTINSFKNGESSQEYALKLGLEKGISGYSYHTLPIVIHIWLKYPNNIKEALKEIIYLGGDTDTTASILGGIIGARIGSSKIPDIYLNNFIEYPRSINWIKELSLKLSKSLNSPQNELEISIFAIFIRNLFFTIIVLSHGFLRIFF
jgi:ADP-ribosyl-[dinitrogen reductase] hydrolase